MATDHPTLGAEELLPELNCFFLSGQRHDRDRIEIQIGFDGLVPESNQEFVYDVDCVVFVPKTLGLLEIDDSQHLRQEFQSYIRLHTHVSNPNNETSLHRVKERLLQLKDKLSLETLRIFAIEFEGYLKGQIKRVKKRTAGTSIELAQESEATQYLINDFRAILKALGLEGKRANDLERGSIDHDLLLLNEYVSHIYVQYLVETYYACQASGDSGDLIVQSERNMKLETEARQTYHFLIEQRHGPQSSADEEQYPRRLSLLKKYFQKSLFVQVQGESLQTRMLIPVYGISAALAASFAILVQLYQAQTVAQRVGINSIALISVGVAAYVAKDIMKDFFRRYFFTKSSRLFPDYEKKLFLNRFSKKVSLGVIKEYLRTFDSEKLPTDLARARYSGVGGEMEEFLHEDVLHFKKRVVLDLSALDSRQEFPWGMREIVRYRFDRLLTSMEDPFKNLHLLSKTGAPATRQGHRVYHVYFAAWIQHVSSSIDRQPHVKPAFKAFRVTLDKTGVLECKLVDWKKIGGIPQPPH